MSTVVATSVFRARRWSWSRPSCARLRALSQLFGERREEAFEEKGQEGQGLARGLAGSGPARTPGEEMRIGRQNILAKSLCCRVCASSLTIVVSAGTPSGPAGVCLQDVGACADGCLLGETRQGVLSLFAYLLLFHRVRAFGSIL